VKSGELVGLAGTLTLPVGKDRPGKVRVELKGRSEDYVAVVEDDELAELPTGTPVLIVAEASAGRCSSPRPRCRFRRTRRGLGLCERLLTAGASAPAVRCGVSFEERMST